MMIASFLEVQNIATQKLKEELEGRLGVSLDFAMSGSGMRLSNQHGNVIMLGNGVNNFTGVNGSIKSPLLTTHTYHQHYPLRKSNI